MSVAPASTLSKGVSEPAVLKESENASLRPVQVQKAVDEARREGVIASIQRYLGDPLVSMKTLEDVLARLHRASEDGRLAK